MRLDFFVKLKCQRRH